MTRRRAAAVAPVLALALVGVLPGTAGATTAVQTLAPGPVVPAAAPLEPTAGDPGEATVEELPVDGVAPEALETLDVPVADVDGTSPAGPPGAAGSDEHGHALSGETGDGELAVLSHLEETAPFDVVGVTWDDPQAVVDRVLLRVRAGDTWSDWFEMEAIDGGAGEESAEIGEGRGGTDPLVAVGSDGVQVRVETADGEPPAGLRVVLVDGGDDATAAASATTAAVKRSVAVDRVTAAAPKVAAATPGRSADALRPALVTRATWGANESMRGPMDTNATVNSMVVHHTVNANGYSRGDVPAIVRGIFNYHVKGRGWSDVGYHFLVDRFGTVYEGRHGSITGTPMGVHTGGFNTNSMGVAAIGDFRSTTPSSAMVDSIARVIAWKLGTFGRDPLGTTIAKAGSGSTSSSRPPGWRGAISVVSGHRDLASTACPGTRLYSLLPTIRLKAARLLTAVASSAPAPAASAGGSIDVLVYSDTNVTWSAHVRSFCTGAAVRTYSGGGTLRQDRMRWDLRSADGAAAAPGLYEVRIDRTVGGTAYEDRHWVEVLGPPRETYAGCDVTRLGGADRFETAVALGRSAYPSGPEVVLVNGLDTSVVDGLVASPFAVSRSAPVLLALKDSLPAATKKEIQRRGATTAWLVGGSGVLSSKLVAELKGMGVTVRRLGGGDRFDTAAAVAREMGAPDGVVIASGAQGSLIDAAGVSGAAAATGRPIVLTLAAELPTVTRRALADLDVREARVIGGDGVVAPRVVRQLTSLGVVSDRAGGSDRFGTSAAVARAFLSEVGGADIMLASGSNSSLIDSLAGGVQRKVTLLVNGAVVPPAVLDVVGDAPVERITIAGGAGVVVPAAVATLARTAGLGAW